MKLLIYSYYIIYLLQNCYISGYNDKKKAVETSADSITIHFNNLPNKAEALIGFPPDENAFDENKTVKVITIIINENRTALKDLNLTAFRLSTNNNSNNVFQSYEKQLVQPASSLGYSLMNDKESKPDPDVLTVYPNIQKNNKHVSKYATFIKPQKPTQTEAQDSQQQLILTNLKKDQYDISKNDTQSFFTITEVKKNGKNQVFRRNYESPKHFSQFFKLNYAPVNSSNTIKQKNQETYDSLAHPLINDLPEEDNKLTKDKSTSLQKLILANITPFYVPIKAVALDPVFQEFPSTPQDENLNYHIKTIFRKFNLRKAHENNLTKQYFEKLYKNLFPGSTKKNLPPVLAAKTIYIQPVITKVHFAGNSMDSKNYKPLLF